jgi:hypothetical protein
MGLFWIILCIGFAVSAICLAIALRLAEKRYKELHNKFVELATNQFVFPQYEVLHKLIVLSDNVVPTVYRRIEIAEAEGYKYNKDKSFPNVLCFTKVVEVKDEEPSES